VETLASEVCNGDRFVAGATEALEGEGNNEMAGENENEKRDENEEAFAFVAEDEEGDGKDNDAVVVGVVIVVDDDDGDDGAGGGGGGGGDDDDDDDDDSRSAEAGICSDSGGADEATNNAVEEGKREGMDVKTHVAAPDFATASAYADFAAATATTTAFSGHCVEDAPADSLLSIVEEEGTVRARMPASIPA
jgi:hypothetical protein